jgi:hypothetical protein
VIRAARRPGTVAPQARSSATTSTSTAVSGGSSRRAATSPSPQPMSMTGVTPRRADGGRRARGHHRLGSVADAIDVYRTLRQSAERRFNVHVSRRLENDLALRRLPHFVRRASRDRLGDARNQAIAKVGTVRGNAARLVRAPVVCLCNRRTEEAGGVTPTQRGRARSARRSRASRTSWSRSAPARRRR